MSLPLSMRRDKKLKITGMGWKYPPMPKKCIFFRFFEKTLDNSIQKCVYCKMDVKVEDGKSFAVSP
jgi:hypothetical protein